MEVPRRKLISSQIVACSPSSLGPNSLLTESIHEIDLYITRVQEFLSASPRSHPVRPLFVYGLAKARSDRYELLNQEDDLEKAILLLTESVLLQPWSWIELPPGTNILFIFYNLAAALALRAKRSRQPEDISYATKYLRYLRDQPCEMFIFPVTHCRVTTALVVVLVFQVQFEFGNMVQHIEEMAILCRELLASHASDHGITHYVDLFAIEVSSKFGPSALHQPPQSLRLARMHKPELRYVQLALVVCLFGRYLSAFLEDDYEEAADVMDEIIASRSPGDSPDEIADAIQQIVTQMAVVRSTTYETLEYSEEAIYHVRAFLSAFPNKALLGSHFKHYLETTANQRLRYFGSIEGLEASSDLGSSQPVLSLNDPELDRIYQTMGLLRGLLSRIPKNDVTKIDEAIQKGRTMIASAATKDPLSSCLFEIFGSILFEAFERTDKIKYLDESIRSFRRILEYDPFPQYRRFRVNCRLGRSLLRRSRSKFPGYVMVQDLEEGLELLAQWVNDGQGNLLDRFQFACDWATIARRTRHPTFPSAYESALSLMQDSLLFAPTLQLQHVTLARSNDYHRMPLDYASYQVDRHQLEDAIVTLEKGRSLLWSEMRYLRASIDRLLQTHPQLGNKYAAINRDLEGLTKSIPPSHRLNIDDSAAAGDLKAADPFGRLLLKQRRLLKERDNLISKIQALPGFDNFLGSPSSDTLRSAASSGPVIIINHSDWRSDIIILLHNASPTLIPTPDYFYHRTTALKDKLLDSRHKYGLDSNHYDETLASVLEDLYNLVGKPVIDRLRQLQVPEQSRVWWCPTSVFCSLPLHAMGPISSDDGEKRYFLDLYICSYTPTLSALIQSRNPGSTGARSSFDRPFLLLVAQPDPSLPTVGGEIQVVQALDSDTKVTGLISEAATPAAVINAFHHHQFVHFACHGTLEAGKPFKAGFELFGDERLTLLEIVRAHIPTAEFAFLSACHTAEITQGSIVDEGLHLAAAVQYCGFRSVVGTMWAMADVDGEDLAKQFYKNMFRRSQKGVSVLYYERSAESLRDAVKKLRRKRGITLERWVNFVHYGA
jgi:CHAT domain-containing protein